VRIFGGKFYPRQQPPQANNHHHYKTVTGGHPKRQEQPLFLSRLLIQSIVRHFGYFANFLLLIADMSSSSSAPPTKKQKIKDRNAVILHDKGGSNSNNNVLASFEPMTLEDIQSRIQSLCERIPAIPNCGPVKEISSSQQQQQQQQRMTEENDDSNTRPDDNNNKNKTNQRDDDQSMENKHNNETRVIFSFATQLQSVLEEFELLSCCIHVATYQWGTERSGAADQNLSLLKGEWNSTRQQISSIVSSALDYLLNPEVELVVETTTVRTVTTTPQEPQPQKLQHNNTNHNNNKTNQNNNDKEEKEKEEHHRSTTNTVVEIRENHYTRQVVNTDYVQFCQDSLARNAPLLRHVVLSNFHKLIKALQDYVQAQKSDSSTSRDFSY
jgi:hypothetical protein